MPQFALEFQIQIIRQETLANYLNECLFEKPTWSVVAIHTMITGKIEPVLQATVVFESPAADMPEATKVEG